MKGWSGRVDLFWDDGFVFFAFKNTKESKSGDLKRYSIFVVERWISVMKLD